MGSPSILMQSGWKFSSIKAGEKVTLIINPMKSGQAGGFLSTATLPDGRVLSNGPRQGHPRRPRRNEPSPGIEDDARNEIEDALVRRAAAHDAGHGPCAIGRQSAGFHGRVGHL